MGEYLINFCGLNSKYMNKMALYFKKRLKNRAETGIWEDVPAEWKNGKHREGCCCIWIGSEEAISVLQKAYGCGGTGQKVSGQQIFLIILTADRSRCSEYALYMYQPCENIYSGIFRLCRPAAQEPKIRAEEKSTCVISFLAADLKGALLPYAMTCAQLLGIAGKTLFVNMASCSGMPELFGLDPANADLADLFLSLREEQEDSLEGFARHIGETDYILPVENPEILDEIGTEDMDRFLSLVHAADYDFIIFAFAEIRSWTRKVLEFSVQVFYLTDPGILSGCRMHELQHYLEKAVPREICHQVKTNPVIIKQCGEHLIYDWLHDVPGNQIRALLNELHIC